MSTITPQRRSTDKHTWATIPRLSAAQQVVNICAGFGMCVGTLLVSDRTVTTGPAWVTIRGIPITGGASVPLIGVIFLACSVLIAFGARFGSRVELWAASAAMVTALFVSSLFIINALDKDGHGALAAVLWVFPAVILLWCVVHLRREL